MAWPDTKAPAIDPDNPTADEQFPYSEYNAMVAYLKDKIINKAVDATAIGDNKILVYKIATDTFVFETQTAITELNDIPNVSISGVPADNEVLAYDTSSSEWINQTPAEAGLATTTQLTALETAAVLEEDFNATTFLYATADDTPQPKTRAEVMAILSGTAATEFLFNTQKIGGVVDPTTAQQVATKNYSDSRLFTKEVVTDFTDGYIPVYNTTSGKFEMEGLAAYLPLAGGILTGPITTKQVNMDGGLVMNDFEITEVTAIQPSGTTITLSAILNLSTHTIIGVVDPTVPQGVATKNYSDSRLFTKEVVTDFTDGYIPVYNTTSGKFEMEGLAAYLPLAGGILTGPITTKQVNMDGGLVMNDFEITEVTAIQPSGTTITLSAILNLSTHTIIGVVDPTVPQGVATKNYSDSRLFTKEVVTDFTDGYIPVYNATSGKFEMEEQSAALGLPVTDTTAIVKGSGDGTKQVRFEVDGLTTGNTRVLTVPDKDVLLEDSAACMLLSGTQAMAGDIDMDDNDIQFINSVAGKSDGSGVVSLHGAGKGATNGAYIQIFGHSVPSYGGDIVFGTPNSGASGVVQAMIIRGMSNTPLVEIQHGLDMNDKVIADMKNSAPTALSGTQKDIEIDIGGTAYYFTVYPTKA